MIVFPFREKLPRDNKVGLVIEKLGLAEINSIFIFLIVSDPLF